MTETSPATADRRSPSATTATRLPDVVDSLATAFGTWIVVEQFGKVLCHGRGSDICPEPLAATLVSKSTSALRGSVRWRREPTGLTGSLLRLAVRTVELGDGATAWFIGDPPDDLAAARSALSDAVTSTSAPLHDSYVERLLHPRGPTAPGRAPAAQLLLLRAASSTSQLEQTCRSVATTPDTRLHAEGDLVVLALAPTRSVRAVFDSIHTRCPDVTAGWVSVPDSSADWVGAAKLAEACLTAAGSLGLALGGLDDPRIAAEVVLSEACEAATSLVRQLPIDPLHALRVSDAKSSGVLVDSLAAWSRAGCDIPAAATNLGVHANTLRYRLKRANEALGIDLSQPRQLLAVQLLLGL